MPSRISASRGNVVRGAPLLVTIVIIMIAAVACGARDRARSGQDASPASSAGAALPAALEAYLTEVFPDSGIPGLAVAVVVDGAIMTRGFGQADEGVPVTDTTAFELASCSKSFTALAALQLAAEGRLAMTDSVGKYLPGFHVRVDGRAHEITVEQLMHHTSGLPWNTIGQIPRDGDDGALRRTAMALSGFEVEERPGSRFVYSSANYDVLGAVIEEASGMEFSAYLEAHIFEPLGLTDTYVLESARTDGMAAGHKHGFFAPRPFTAPLYRANAPAGYIASTARDMGRWLAIQLGVVETPLAPLVELSHVADREVAPDYDGASYAAGWSVYQKPKGELSHAGDNPSFTSYVGFSPGGRFGVALLANSDSPQTARLGENLMALLRGAEPEPLPRSGGTVDRASSVAASCIGVLILAALVILGRILRQALSKRRRFRRPPHEAVAVGVGAALALIAVIGCVVMLPRAVAGIPLETAVIWLPWSFPVALGGLAVLLLLGYAVCIASALFPSERGVRGELPQLVALSLVAGISNAGLIFLIAAAPAYDGPLAAILYYFVVVALLYLASRKYVDKRAVTLAYRVVHDLRARLTARILTSRFQDLERIDSGRVAGTLNNDTHRLGQSMPIVVPLVTNAVTTIAVGVYLATVSFVAFLAAAAVVTIIAVVFSWVDSGAARYWKEEGQAQTRFLNLLDGLLRGFKELSMHTEKRRGFGADMDVALATYTVKRTRASAAHLNSFMIGEALLVGALGTIAFIFPRFLDGFDEAKLTTFVMGLLYIIGPLTGILRAVPTFTEARATWNRILTFEAELTSGRSALLALPPTRSITHLTLDGVTFQYPASDDSPGFSIGPASMEVKSGEILFLVGGNGSGKTTLARLLTGLYQPTAGQILVNGRSVGPEELGELVSVVFADFHLFPRLYDVTLAGKEGLVEHHLDVLRLKNKVTLDDSGFSTLDLSTGQRKRLALLKCLLEDRPILLFDEWAADQDPEFRRTFYRELLPALKRAGKLVIAITHDEQYFDAADRIVSLELGQLSQVKPSRKAS